MKRGFTLIELVLVLATAAVLALLAAGSYVAYVTRAGAAQTLLNVDHIVTVTRVENRLDNPDLQLDAAPGAAPPRLKGLLSDSDFVGREGITLWMIKAPAGTFSSFLDRSTYALVANAPAPGMLELAALRRALAWGEGDLPWLDAQSFAFPIEMLAQDAVAGVPRDCKVEIDYKGKKEKEHCWCRYPNGTRLKINCASVP